MVYRNQARGASDTGRTQRRHDVLTAVVLVAKSGRGWFYATVVMMSMSGLGAAAAILIGRKFVAVISDQPYSQSAVGLGIGTLLLLGLVLFAQLASTGLHRILVEKVTYAFNLRILQALSNSSIDEFERPEFHDRITRARQSATASIGIAMAVPQLVSGVISGVGLVLSVGVTKPEIIPFAILSGVPPLLAGRANSSEMYSFSFGHTPEDRERFYIESVLGSRDQSAEVRIFGLENYLVRRWRGLYDDRISDLIVLVRRFLRRSVVAAGCTSLSILVIVAAVYWMHARGDLSLVDSAALLFVTLLLASQMQRVALGIAKLSEHGQHLQDYFAIAEVHGIRAEDGRMRPSEPMRTLELSEVTFSYPSAKDPALKDVSLCLRAGEMVAIVGSNGSGKTTLAKLLCGLYRPDEGSATWNDLPLESVDTRGETAAVFQTFARYWFSAAENIGVGDIGREGRVDMDDVHRAAREVGVDDFVSRLPEGYSTPLAVELEGGVDLSIGQWQRIALARVVCGNPSLIVLDEPTSALDAEAEADLFDLLSRLRIGRTIVVISHRFSTVRSADRILVLDHGRVIEEGSHESLMAVGGRYAHLYGIQADMYKAAGH